MVDYGVALSWIIISPLALITDVLAIIIIVHYFPFFHGTDVTMLSLLCAMAGNAILVLPIPALVEITETTWTATLCNGYVWCFMTFRLCQILSLSVMSIHWSTLLKMSAEKKKYFSTKFLKITIIFIWLVSAIFGLLPTIGVTNDEFAEKTTKCQYLAFNLGAGYGLFFIIVIMATMFVSIICASDATFLIKHMKVVAKTKYQTGRFHIPEKNSEVPGPGVSSLIQRFHRLNFAWDLSKFVLFYVIVSFLANHFPYAIIQGIQVFTNTDNGILEVIVIYLVGIEALLLPHALWFLSRRYKHALMYQWKLYILRRQNEEEEDPYSCTLQSYTQRERDRASVGPSRPPSRGAVSASGTMRSTKSDVLGSIHIHTNGRTQIASIVNDISRSYPEHRNGGATPINGMTRGEIHVETHSPPFEERAIDTQDLEIRQTANSNTSDFDGKDSIRRVSEFSSSTTSQASNKGTLFSPGQEVQRSTSNVSRKDWKEKIRKKHLPSIFINEGFESGDNKAAQTTKVSTIDTMYKGEVGNMSTSSLHFYMSSDYHPDYLTDTLPRHKLPQSVDTESDGVAEYKDSDITEVLDNNSLESEEHYGAKSKSKSYIGMDGTTSNATRPFLSSFKSPPSLEKDDKLLTAGTTHVKGIYSTFEDLSQSGFKEESEIEFDPGSIPFDNIDGGYNSYKGLSRKSNTTSTCDIPNKRMDIYSTNTASLSRFQLYDTNDIEMTSTSFGKANQFKDGVVLKPARKSHLRNAGRNDIRNSKEIEKTANSEVLSPSNENVSGGSDDNGKNIQTRTTSIDDEYASSGSNSSVTLSPYKGEGRHRPWMDDVIDQGDDVLQMSEPLVLDSDTDTLRDSHETHDYLFGSNFDGRNSHSELSTPVSSIFDEETERGFEEALEMHANAGVSVYGGVGLCFESIKEEPEDLTSSGSNPFLDHDEEFKTHAIISRNSTPNSLTSSSTSVSENPFSSSPKRSPKKGENVSYEAPIIIRTDFEADMADSGFTSGLEKGNMSDSSSQQDFAPRAKQLSPWPDHDENIQTSDLSFETDFCDNAATFAANEHVVKHPDHFSLPSRVSSVIKSGNLTPEMSPDTTLKSRKVTTQDFKKPVHKMVADIMTSNRQAPVRVQSFEGVSSVPLRIPPKRGNSFEVLRTDIKPAYF